MEEINFDPHVVWAIICIFAAVIAALVAVMPKAEPRDPNEPPPPIFPGF